MSAQASGNGASAQPKGRGRRVKNPAPTPASSTGMAQVAERAGVAVSSVSRVLSGHADVSEAMRSRVMAAVEELGYQPNMLAQMLRRGATRTIGFVVGDISNPLLAQITLGAEVALREAGYTMLLTNSVNDPALDAANIGLLQQRRVDGLLLSLSDETSDETVEALARIEAPAVLVDRELPASSGVSAVLSDHRAGITQAVAHLVELGHQRITLIAGSPHVRPTRERINALEEAVEQYPGVVAQVRPGAFTEAHGRAATRELLDSRRPPTALIAGGNQILVGVIGELTGRKVAIPHDLSLVTCDDVPLAQFFTPALATVRRDPYEMGTVAARLLLDRLNGAEPDTTILPAVFHPAASCAPPRS
ncbi:LacI family DNA-binding transcriptional regulator [Streptomyces sp. NPDC001508]|uniref:LacI family DNA-binding transcriptional regulator n=1 Tax=Streptomyces sp. NPDC001508 TaxID=3154656 RepID=UPI00332BAD00